MHAGVQRLVAGEPGHGHMEIIVDPRKFPIGHVGGLAVFPQRVDLRVAAVVDDPLHYALFQGIAQVDQLGVLLLAEFPQQIAHAGDLFQIPLLDQHAQGLPHRRLADAVLLCQVLLVDDLVGSEPQPNDILLDAFVQLHRLGRHPTASFPRL